MAQWDSLRATKALIKTMMLRAAGLLLVFYVGWVVVIGYCSTQRMTWNIQSRDFLNAALIPVVNDPSVFAFRALADPRWREELNREGGSLTRTLTHLGPLQAFRVRGGTELLWRHDLTIAAHYHLFARFRGGTAVFQVALIKHHNSWRISQLRIMHEGRSP